MKKVDVLIVGGGVIGLATAYQLLRSHPHLCVCVLEKENDVAFHQTGHNSGVIHSGLYYRPGSLKAKNCAEGRKELIAFADEHHVAYDICGKIVVATDFSELPHLEKIAANGRANGLHGVEQINADEIRELEPHCQGVVGLHVPEAGIIHFPAIGKAMMKAIREMGAENGSEVLTNHKVLEFEQREEEIAVLTNQGLIKTKHLIACAGLYCDEMAKKEEQLALDMRIVPFRGDYYDLTHSGQHKIRNLIYPVPNPDFPFLGVHFTRMIGGGVECGPNAVFNFKKEGYGKTDFDLKDTWNSLSFPGTWRLFMKHWKDGMEEYKRAFSKKLFLNQLQRLVPSLTMEDLIPGRAGVRAQALDVQGKMIDDFRIECVGRNIHVLNAPSPAATSSLAIGRSIQKMAAERFDLG